MNCALASLRSLAVVIFVSASSLLSAGDYKSVKTEDAIAIPDTIASALPNRKPVWVSAEVAFDNDGALQKNLFSNEDVQSLESYRNAVRSQRKPDTDVHDCVVTLKGSGPEIPVSIDSADDLARNSIAVLRAEVAGARPGFYMGLPGTLFALRVSDRLKNIGGVSNARIVYVFVDTARIETSQGMICAKSFANPEAVPAVGDQVLLFAIFDAPDASHLIVPVLLERTMVVQHGARLSLPRSLRSAKIQTIDQATTAIRGNPRLQELPARFEARR